MGLGWWAVGAAAEAPGLRAGPGVGWSAPERIRVEAGSFVMGADAADQAFAADLCRAEAPANECAETAFAAEGPAHRVYVSTFAIDRLEVSFADYGRCRDALVCPPSVTPEPDPGTAASHWPVTGVTFADARRYCRFVGGRLPREAEWERAARGGSARRFPWGAQWNSRLAHHGAALGRDVLGRPLAEPISGRHAPMPVDSFPDGASAYGLRHMAGNVWEWTADRFAAGYDPQSPAVDPRGPEQGDARVVRGGSFLTRAHLLRVTARRPMAETAAEADVGFRCAYDLPGP